MSNSQNDRYITHLKKAVSARSFSLLQATDGLFAMFEDDNEQAYVPVWADSDAALKAAEEEWTGYALTEMRINEMRKWLNELTEDEIFIGAFPDEDLHVVPVSPEVFKEHIKNMLLELDE